MSRQFNHCVILGLGYIGLPTAVLIAQAGIQVTGVDIDHDLIETINGGISPIRDEPGLPEAIGELVKAGAICARRDPVVADVYIIAVPTPFTGGFKPDLAYVEAATRAIAPVLRPDALVIVESTIPVGATEQVGHWLERMRPDLEISKRNRDVGQGDVLLAHCPERVLPGQMLRELAENDRIIGGVCANSAQAGREFYETFVRGKCHTADARTAELAKLSENAFRDVNIAFANELASICEGFDINPWRLIELANHHPRVNILQPGPGVGGHCIAVDPWFIVSSFGEQARLIREARWINSGRPRQVARKVLQVADQFDARTIGVFGLAYKPNVADLRESPAIEVVTFVADELGLLGKPVKLLIVEPHIAALPPELDRQANVELVPIEAALKADVLVMLVDHRQFYELKPDVRQKTRLIDTRGIWNFDEISHRLAIGKA